MPLVTLGVNSLEQSEIAHASAIVNTVRQFGLSFGVIVLTTIITISTNSTSLPYNKATFNGIKNAFIVMSVLSLIGVITSFFIKVNRR